MADEIPDAPQQNTPDVESLRVRAANAERELAVRQALHGIDWCDAEDAYHELARRATLSADGKWEVELPAPAGAGQPPRKVTPADAARELARLKPHWVRARVRGGTGAGSGTSAADGNVTYAELLKPENRARLQEYIHEHQDELERLRQAHFNK